MAKYAVVTIAMLGAFGAVAAGLGFATGGLRRADPRQGPPRPVLVELFTSEGCSSCPAADRLLTELVDMQPVDGAQVIALGEHVDYWDRLGWRDPFSSADFSRRQEQYQTWVFGSSTVYTPQMVIDGTRESVGSWGWAVRRDVAQASWSAKGDIAIAPGRPADGKAPLTIRVTNLPRGSTVADLYAAVTQDGLVTEVAAGENSGRTLSHTAVARSLGIVSEAVPRNGDAFSTDAELTLDPEWGAERLNVVAFVQERGTRRILAAGVSPLAVALP